MDKQSYPRYAIFDMDGTLLDSMRAWRGARGEYLRSIGLEPTREVLSVPLTELPAVFLREYGLRMTVDEIRVAIFGTVLLHYRTDVTPYANVVEILHGIVRTGGKAVVLTATPHPYADEALARFGLRESLVAVFGPEDNGNLGKGDPSSFRMALEALGCDDPSECTVYEDALYSIRTAKEMGFRVASVLDPSAERDRAEILSLSDEVIVPTVGERCFPYRYALFDMDGTLIDSMEELTRSYHAVLSAVLPPAYRREVSFFVPFACYEAREALRRISEALGISLDVETLVRSLMCEIERRYRTTVRPYPEMMRRLKALADDGVRLGVITATPHPQCDIALRAAGLSEYLSFAMTPADNGGVGKSDPSISRLALSRLGCEDPREAAMYEDAPYSLGTAKALGMRCVAVLDRMASHVHGMLREISDEVICPTPVTVA